MLKKIPQERAQTQTHTHKQADIATLRLNPTRGPIQYKKLSQISWASYTSAPCNLITPT